MPVSPPANAYYLSDPAQRNRAQGILTADASLPKGIIPQTGGMQISQTKTFDEQTLLIRFSRQTVNGVTLDDSAHLNSPWWITRDMFEWLMSRALASSRGISTIIREQLLLPPEWTDADCFVQAYPRKNISLGAWFGPPRTVQAHIGGVTSRWTAAGKQAPESWMYQLYIPGLDRSMPMNAQKWLQFEGLYGVLPVPGPALSRFPRLRKGKLHGS
jgi:hypothetical protein